jgi:hypothetical protein
MERTLQVEHVDPVRQLILVLPIQGTRVISLLQDKVREYVFKLAHKGHQLMNAYFMRLATRIVNVSLLLVMEMTSVLLQGSVKTTNVLLVPLVLEDQRIVKQTMYVIVQMLVL